MNTISASLDMRYRKYTLGAIILITISTIYFIHLKREINKLEVDKNYLLRINEALNLRLERVIDAKQEKSVEKEQLPTVYAITPTYKRYEQKADLTRIAQMLLLVPHVHWIIIEDAEVPSELVTNFLLESNLVKYTHLYIKTASDQKLINSDRRWTKHRGVEQRNLGLQWLRKHKQKNVDKGIVYFMDDDNTYNIKIFFEMTKIKKVGIWPVGLVGGYSAEVPVLDPKTGKVVKYITGWKAERPFATDMAGFAINLSLILEHPEAEFKYNMRHGYLESEFLAMFVKKDELEPLADNCTKILVWHTRTEKTKVAKVLKDIEV